MISVEYLKEQDKTYQEEIKELQDKVNYYKNKSNRCENCNKHLQEKLDKINEYVNNLEYEEIIKANIQKIINEGSDE